VIDVFHPGVVVVESGDRFVSRWKDTPVRSFVRRRRRCASPGASRRRNRSADRSDHRRRRRRSSARSREPFLLSLTHPGLRTDAKNRSASSVSLSSSLVAGRHRRRRSQLDDVQHVPYPARSHTVTPDHPAKPASAAVFRRRRRSRNGGRCCCRGCCCCDDDDDEIRPVVVVVIVIMLVAVRFVSFALPFVR